METADASSKVKHSAGLFKEKGRTNDIWVEVQQAETGFG